MPAEYQAVLTSLTKVGDFKAGPLSHAMIFCTAGEALREAIPGHTPYAEANGIWRRGMGTYKPALDAAWKPYLGGEGTLDDAITAVLRALR